MRNLRRFRLNRKPTKETIWKIKKTKRIFNNPTTKSNTYIDKSEKNTQTF